MRKKIKNMMLVELGILFLVLMIYICINLDLIKLMPECIINKHFHILCPSCGGTRSVISFLKGNLIESFKYHQIFFLTIIYLFIVNIIFIINAFRKEEILKKLYPTIRFWIIFIIIILVFTVFRNIL